MLIEQIVNSISKYFRKKFLLSTLFLFALFQLIFISFQYKYVKNDVSLIEHGIKSFLQDMISVSFKIHEGLERGGVLKDQFQSAMQANIFITDIKLTEETDKIKIINYDSEKIILKTNIVLEGKRKGLDLYIKKEAVSTYIIPYTKSNYNYNLYSEDKLITAVTFQSNKNISFNYKLFIDNPVVNWRAEITIPLFNLLSTLIKIDTGIFLFLCSLYFYVFYGYKAFSKQHIKSPLLQIIQDMKYEKVKNELEEIKESSELLNEMENLLNNIDSQEKKKEKPSAKDIIKNCLKMIKYN